MFFNAKFVSVSITIIYFSSCVIFLLDFFFFFRKTGLAKNVRVRITKIEKYKIYVVNLVGQQRLHIIPRIRFKISYYFGYTLMRTQFPLQLAYAMTKNKAQGQSLEVSLNDCREPSFCHGQEYVGLSRATDFSRVAIFCSSDQIYDGHVVIVNVVYPELFEH